MSLLLKLNILTLLIMIPIALKQSIDLRERVEREKEVMRLIRQYENMRGTWTVDNSKNNLVSISSTSISYLNRRLKNEN